MKRIVLIAALALLPLVLSSCNTVRGMGEDISGATTATQKAIGR